MAITANAIPKDGFKYIPVSEKGKDDAFSVKVKLLDSKTLLKLEDKAVTRRGDDVSLESGAFFFEVCVRAIQNWENFTEADGTQIVCEKDNEGFIKEDVLMRVPATIIIEIANAVTAASREPYNTQVLFEQDEKEA